MEKQKRIALTEATKETLTRLRERMNATSPDNVTFDAVIRRAAALLVVELDRQEAEARAALEPSSAIAAPDHGGTRRVC